MMDQVSEVLKEVQRLHSKDGYFSRFFELCSENPDSTYKSNYHLLEIEYFALFKCFRYSDYQSFKVIKTRYLDKSKKG